MTILLWLIPYYGGQWNYIALTFYGAIAVGLIWEVFSTLREARRDYHARIRSEEVQAILKESKRVKYVPELEVIEDVECKEVIEMVRQEPSELSSKEVDYIEEDEQEANLRRKKVKSTGPPEAA